MYRKYEEEKKKKRRFVTFEFDGKIPSVLMVKTQDKDSKETVSVTPSLHQPHCNAVTDIHYNTFFLFFFFLQNVGFIRFV